MNILKIKKLTKIEDKYIRVIQRIFQNIICPFYYDLARKIPELNHLIYKTKDDFNSNDNVKKEFGYYINTELTHLYLIIKTLKIKSFLDLGSGPGLLLGILSYLFPTIKFAGYDNEKLLIEGNKMYSTVSLQLKNILTLTSIDVENYDALYFWEPLNDSELCKQFVENLVKIVKNDQYIIYKPSGEIQKYLSNPEIKKIIEPVASYYGYIIYKCKKH